jgi:hypothetical protein
MWMIRLFAALTAVAIVLNLWTNYRLAHLVEVSYQYYARQLETETSLAENTDPSDVIIIKDDDPYTLSEEAFKLIYWLLPFEHRPALPIDQIPDKP